MGGVVLSAGGLLNAQRFSHLWWRITQPVETRGHRQQHKPHFSGRLAAAEGVTHPVQPEILAMVRCLTLPSARKESSRRCRTYLPNLPCIYMYSGHGVTQIGQKSNTVSKYNQLV